MIYDHSLLKARFERDEEVYAFPNALYECAAHDSDRWMRIHFHETICWHTDIKYRRVSGIDEVEVMLSELELLFKKDAISKRYLDHVAINFTKEQTFHFCMNVEAAEHWFPDVRFAVYPDSEIRYDDKLFVARVENHVQAENKRKYYSELLTEPEAFKKWEFRRPALDDTSLRGFSLCTSHPKWYPANVYQPHVVSINDYKSGDMLTIDQVRALCKDKEDDELIDLLKNIEYKRVTNAMWHPVYKIPKVKDSGCLDRNNYRTWRVIHIADHPDSKNKNSYYDSMKSNGKPQSWQKLTEDGTWKTLDSGNRPIWGAFTYRPTPKMVVQVKSVPGIIDFQFPKVKDIGSASFTDILKGRSPLGKNATIAAEFASPPKHFYAHTIPPATIEVHGKKLNAPLVFASKMEEVVFIPSLAATDLYFRTSWIATEHQESVLKRGLVFNSKQDAIDVAKHLLEGNSAFRGYK